MIELGIAVLYDNTKPFADRTFFDEPGLKRAEPYVLAPSYSHDFVTAGEVYRVRRQRQLFLLAGKLTQGWAMVRSSS